MKPVNPLILARRKELKSCDPKSRDRVRDRLRALELLKVLRDSPRHRARVGNHRSPRTENVSA